MFLHYQTRADIQRVVIDALLSLGRPASAFTIAAWAFNRSLIDGTRESVHCTIKHEVKKMWHRDILVVSKIEIDDCEPVHLYVIYDTLTAMAISTS